MLIEELRCSCFAPVFKVDFIFLSKTKIDSPVYSPIDGKKWLNAKMELQIADFAYEELVEHLAKTHLLMEPMCVIMQRTLSKFHPLYQIFLWHCRGLFVVDSLGLTALFGENEFLRKLFSIGYSGGLELINRAYNEISWDTTDFATNLRVKFLIFLWLSVN